MEPRRAPRLGHRTPAAVPDDDPCGRSERPRDGGAKSLGYALHPVIFFGEDQKRGVHALEPERVEQLDPLLGPDAQVAAVVDDERGCAHTVAKVNHDA